jgi:hypothetical protein
MTTWIRIPHRIVVDVSIPVPGLHALGLERHHRVRLNEAPQRAVVPPGPVEMQPQRDQLPLPGEVELGRRSPLRVALLAPGPKRSDVAQGGPATS